jgi:hypothetical protein
MASPPPWMARSDRLAPRGRRHARRCSQFLGPRGSWPLPDQIPGPGLRRRAARLWYRIGTRRRAASPVPREEPRSWR